MPLIPEIAGQGQRWVDIDPDTPLVPGDRILLTFQTSEYVWAQSAEIAMIHAYCEGRDDFVIIRNSLVSDNLIDFEIEIKSRYMDQTGSEMTAGIAPVLVPILVTAAKVALVIAGTALIGWLVFRGAKKLVGGAKEFVSEAGKTAGGQVALAGMGAVGVAILIYIIAKALGLWK